MLSQEGFLSPEINDVEQNFEKEFAFIFEKIRGFNKFFQEITFKFIIKRNTLLHWCLAALYLRSLSLYQAIFILCKKGITGESNILLRSLYEIKYLAIALSKYPDLVFEYLGQEAIEMKHILKDSKKWDKSFPQGLSLKEVEDKLKEVETEINTNKLKKKTIKNFAEEANMLMDYEMNYSILCLTGHSNIYDIKKHFVLDEEGIIKTFNWGPNKNNVTTILGNSTETMFAIVDPLRDIFSLQIEEEYHRNIMDYNTTYTKLIKHI
jgi:hypothetical protein